MFYFFFNICLVLGCLLLLLLSVHSPISLLSLICPGLKSDHICSVWDSGGFLEALSDAQGHLLYVYPVCSVAVFSPICGHFYFGIHGYFLDDDNCNKFDN